MKPRNRRTTELTGERRCQDDPICAVEEEAAEINNGGLESQPRFLLEHNGAFVVEEIIRQIRCSTGNIVRYWHVTLVKNLPEIKRNGLRPKRQRRGIGGDDRPPVYLFKTKEDAEDGLPDWRRMA